MGAPMRFDFTFSRPGAEPRRPRPESAPMRMLVMADLGGRAGARAPLAERPLASVDHETLDAVFARVHPGLTLGAGNGGPALALDFGRLEDFHPDVLFERVGLFGALRETRRRLQDPATFAAAASELGVAAPVAAAAAGPAESDTETLGRLLGTAPAGAVEVPVGDRLREDVQRLVRALVAPYVVPAADPREQELIASVDRAIADRMRVLLHDPALQELESTWRSIARLVAEAETGEEIQIALLDVGRGELASDLGAAGTDLEASGLYSRLVARGSAIHGAHPWSVVVAATTFGPEPADIALLGALGAIASRAGGPLLAAASPRLLGCRSIAETPDPRAWDALAAEDDRAWQALRASPWARWIGLAVPRVLLRLPYGARGERTERFAFEELEPARPHESFLWGHPAFACATLLARSFRERGAEMSPGDHLELDDLPAYSYRDDGEAKLMPCAEALLTERALGEILGRGLMPLASFPDRNAARVVRFQSIADPPAPLAGAWS